MGRLPTPSVGLLLTVLVLGVVALTVNSEDVGGSGSAAASPAAPWPRRPSHLKLRRSRLADRQPPVPDSDRASMDPLRPHLHRDLVTEKSPPALTPGDDRSGSTRRAPILKRGEIVSASPSTTDPAPARRRSSTCCAPRFPQPHSSSSASARPNLAAQAGRIRAAGEQC